MDQSLLQDFQVKVPFTIESQGFVIKTAQNLADLKMALKLRHQVFLEEGLNRTHESGLEFDEFDQKADHLIIIEPEKDRAVGTYRLIHSNFSSQFYSQGEFHLDDFLKEEGSKLEMGRACTHVDHRTGRTMDLLWQGLSQYIRETQTRYLFGCSSVDSTEPAVVFSIAKSLQSKDSLSFKYNIKPTAKYQFDEAQKHMDQATENPGVLRILPPLLRSYLHAGSQVHGFPALDKDFECTDMLTILDLNQLNKKFAERYNLFPS
jgi:putative hemolysin